MLAEVLIEMSGKKDIKVQNIGIRHGEKMYESLLNCGRTFYCRRPK